MCLPNNTGLRRLALADGQAITLQAQRNNILNMSIVFAIKSATVDTCEAPKRRGSILTSDYNDLQDQGRVLDLSMVSGIGPKPPKRLESMPSDCSDTTESTTSSDFGFAAERQTATEFLGKSKDKRLRMLKRHMEIHGQ
jgi:hypothetical protein